MADNADLIAIFDEMADILDIQGANPFKVRAYRNAVRAIEALGEPLDDMLKRAPDKLDAIPGIGKGLHDKIVEFCASGNVREHDELKATIPPGLLDMLRIPSFGPKHVKLVHDKLGIKDVDALEAAAAAGTLRDLPGMGEKSEAKLLKSIREYRNLHVDRTPWAAAEHILDPFLEHLRAAKGIDQLAPAGSFRRCRETIGDLDILATVTGDPAAVITHFVRYPRVVEVLAEGDTKASVVLKEKLQVDLRVVETDAFGAALQYFTGSKEHNVALRSRAKDGGLKVSEYGVFRGDSRIAGKSEEDVYAALGLEWIPPELRENRGEIDAAADHKLPKLVTLEDIKGDLHAHSTYTDGTASIAEMAAAARKRGYSYLAITDHSKAVTIAHGLDAKRVRQQLEEIKAVRATLKGFHLLSGIEVDILGDGSLDLPDDVLAELDWVVASVHSKFDLDEAAMTKRIIRALGNPHVNCIGHPTGRLIGQRGEYRVDLHAVIKAAAAHHTALEINAAPERLDLNDHYAYLAREAGVPLAISTDAHHPASFSDARYGINMARRAWCTARDILNAWPWETFSKWLHK